MIVGMRAPGLAAARNTSSPLPSGSMTSRISRSGVDCASACIALATVLKAVTSKPSRSRYAARISAICGSSSTTKTRLFSTLLPRSHPRRQISWIAQHLAERAGVCEHRQDECHDTPPEHVLEDRGRRIRRTRRCGKGCLDRFRFAILQDCTDCDGHENPDTQEQEHAAYGCQQHPRLPGVRTSRAEIVDACGTSRCAEQTCVVHRE